MRGEVHILVHCPIDTLQWGSTHSALIGKKEIVNKKRSSWVKKTSVFVHTAGCNSQMIDRILFDGFYLSECNKETHLSQSNVYVSAQYYPPIQDLMITLLHHA